MRFGKAGTPTETCEGLLDKTIEASIYAALIFSPLAFGVVHAWSEALLGLLVAVAWFALLLKLVFQPQTQITWSWAYLPIAAFLLLALFQLTPLPFNLVALLSPHTAGLKQELLGDLPQAHAVLSRPTLTFYANATRHDLRTAMALGSVFFVIINVFHDPRRIKRLLAVIAATGAAIILLAIAQTMTNADGIYWSVTTAHQLARSGPFVNHSHFAQFVNLSMGAALALIFVQLHESFTARGHVVPGDVLDYFGSPDAWKTWLLTGVVIAGVVSVFLSLTRGGMLSLLVAGALTVLLLGSRGSLKGRGWALALMCLCAFICVLYIGFDAVYDRLATLDEWDRVEGGRLQIIKDIAVICTQFPLFGTGLGTHRVVFPMFDRSLIPYLAGHAENEYAQLAEEMGAFGVILLLAFGGMILLSYRRTLKKASVPINSAAYGLGFGLAAILFHSLSDFGQHLPANALLSTTFCALLVILGKKKGQYDHDAGFPIEASRFSKSLRHLVLGLSAIAWLWILTNANDARIAESHWRPVEQAQQDLEQNQEQATGEEYATVIDQAALALHYAPDDVFYRYWTGLFNWFDITQNVDPNGGGIAITESALERSERIVDTMNLARAACPTFGPAYCVLGELEKHVLDRAGGTSHIRVGFRLAPCDPIACFVAGRLDAAEGRHDSAKEKLNRAVRLDSRLFTDVLDISLDTLEDPNFAISLCGQDSGRLGYVLQRLSSSEQYRDSAEGLIEQNRTRQFEILKAACEREDAPSGTFVSLADHYLAEGDREEALTLYRKALVRDYANLSLRYRLATLLEEEGDLAGAMREAKTCLRLKASYEPARQLVSKLAVIPLE